jgi:hypothetical protein
MAATVVAAMSARAATNVIDFNSDPDVTGLYKRFGNVVDVTGADSSWRSVGGAGGGANNGYLAIADAAGSLHQSLVFKDLENGLIIQSFSFDCDVRIGGGTEPPADGFSISLASSTDPVVVASDADTDPIGSFAGIAGEASGLPEEGTTTGLSVGFDEWQSGTSDPQDVAGLSIRVDGQLIAQLPLPLGPGNIYISGQPVPGNQGALYTYDNSATYHNLATNDVNYLKSLQTGARNTTDDLNGDGTVDASDPNTAQPAYDPADPTNYNLWLKNLEWAHFHMEVTPDAHVKIAYKGVELTPAGGLATQFGPRVGRIVFGGRTGGSWAALHIDNIKLNTTAFTSAALSGFSGNAGGFTLQITDQGTTVLDSTTLVAKLNGTTVPLTLSKTGTITYAHYTAPTPLAVNSVNNVDITYKDNFGVASAATRAFTVASYVSLDAAWALPTTAVSGSGFAVKMHQIAVGRGPGDGTSTANAERQLANRFWDPATGIAYPNIIPNGSNPDGTYPVSVINWNQSPASATDPVSGTQGVDIGDFQGNADAPADAPGNVADSAIPGITGGDDNGDPTSPTYNNNIVSSAKTYLSLKQGFYTFGVNSDDGFRVIASASAGDLAGVTLGEFNGGRGSSDTLFSFYAPADGVYPFTIEWWEGGGGANCEFFYVDQTSGTKRLINDLRYGVNQIKAYPTSTITRPAVTRLQPERNQLFVVPDLDVAADVTDGTIAVEAGSVALTVNGVAVSAAPTKAGAVTTIKSSSALPNLLKAGANSATLIYGYTDGAVHHLVTNNWSFTVLPYGVLQAGAKVAAGNVSGSGFSAIVNQMDRSLNNNGGDGGRLTAGDANRMPRPERQLAGGEINPTNGLAYPNLADLSGADANGIFSVGLETLNYNNGALDFANSGIFNDDVGMPGLPGGGTSGNHLENYVAEFSTYLELKKGTYIFGVNSDDGFVVSSAPSPHDTLGVVLGSFLGGRGNSGAPLPLASAFSAVVPEDGVYPIRVLYWQGGGGVNVEFMTLEKGNGAAALVNDGNPGSVVAHNTYTGTARPWVKFSVSPTPWDNRIMQSGPGLTKAYGRTVTSNVGGDINTSDDNTRPWADVGIGAVLTNLNGGSVSLLLDGVAVPAVITTAGGDTTVSYRPNPPLPSGSSHKAALVYANTTNSWSFTVQTYTNLLAADAKDLSLADPTAVGFHAKVVQATTGQPNTVARAETQLAGGIPNVALPGPNADGSYTVPGIINWNNNLNPTTSGGPVRVGDNIGNFQKNVYGAGWPYGDHPDEAIPGLPGTGLGNCDNSAAEFFAYLAFPTAGYYRFGVNSDDGFAVKIGLAGQTNGTVVFNLDAGKGSSDVPFSVVVPAPGIYPVRLIWYNGGGGANVEFFTYDDNGNKIAVNDLSNPASIKAYYALKGGGTAPKFTSVTSAGGNLTITWEGTGKLQQSATLAPSAWTDVTPQPTGNTYTVPASGTDLFFRILQ